MGMGGMGGMSMDGGDVDYPLYVINGKAPADPDVLTAKPGQKVRLRIINASADSVFDVALADHQLQITHTDGYPVNPVQTSLLRMGMGERYDAVVTLKDGVFPLVARRSGKPGLARALVRTGSGTVPSETFEPTELTGYPMTADTLSAAPGAALPAAAPDTTQDVVLAGSMAPYIWTINGRTYDETIPLTVAAGQTTRLRVMNHSMMAHPIHLHGHTFQLGAAGGSGTRKDTVLVPSMGSVDVAVLADNPGQWALHCHTAVHMAAGMMTRLDYTT
jgi:FtsP/CotA-like multicopper oxidase with cupredoxin domain